MIGEPHRPRRKLGERRSRLWLVALVVVLMVIFGATDGALWFGPHWWRDPAWYAATAAGLITVCVVGLGLRRFVRRVDPLR